MPTLNYENAGALVEYDYLQGTITALDPEDDTADVSGACGSLSKIPIFYHCEPSSVARENGALEGAAGAFSVGDSVIVLKTSGYAKSSLYSLSQIELKGAESTATGPGYFVVGRYDGMKKCASGQVLIYGERPSYGTVWFFVWDLSTDDYATAVTAQYNHVIQKTEYPWDTQNQPDVLSAWKAARFSSLSGIASFVDEAKNLFIDNDFDFGGSKIKVGDYVYLTNKPWTWSKVRTVAGGIITTVEPVLNDEDWHYTVSASLPLFYEAERWTLFSMSWPSAMPDGTELCYTPLYHPYTGELLTAYQMFSPDYSISAENIETQHYNLVAGTSEIVALSGTSATKTYTRQSYTCGGTAELPDGTTPAGASGTASTVDPPGIWPAWSVYAVGVSMFDLYQYVLNRHLMAEYRGNLGGDYTRDWMDKSALTEKPGTWITPSGWVYHDWILERGSEIIVDGRLNPLLDKTLYEVSSLFHYIPLPERNYTYGDSIRPTGELAICTDNFCFQFYTYPGYERNTVGQCARRPSSTSPPNTSRSAKLEQAIKDLIQAIVDQTSATAALINVWGIYYTSGREAVGGTMLQLINAARGIDALHEDSQLMGQCESHAAVCVAGGVSQHTTDMVNEVISVHPDTNSLSKVVESWMQSPLHAAAIMAALFGQPATTFGWAEGTYPASVTQITIESGTYDPGTGGYSEEPTVYDVPVALRGHMKFYIVQIYHE